jgi:hypothetical protein
MAEEQKDWLTLCPFAKLCAIGDRCKRNPAITKPATKQAYFAQHPVMPHHGKCPKFIQQDPIYHYFT